MKVKMQNGKFREKEKKIGVSVLAGILLLILYGIIFSFSQQDAEQSGSISQYLSERCVELYNAIAGKHWTETVVQEMAEYFEHPLRKAAHFAEYAYMGILVTILLKPWIKKNRTLIGCSILWVFISAAMDEIHQLFVPGRYGCFADVCLDTLGGIFGILFCMLIFSRAGRSRGCPK